MNDDESLEVLQSELREINCGSLSVVVDFVELIERFDEETAYTMIGKLKDLLT